MTREELVENMKTMVLEGLDNRDRERTRQLAQRHATQLNNANYWHAGAKKHNGGEVKRFLNKDTGHSVTLHHEYGKSVVLMGSTGKEHKSVKSAIA